MAKRKLTLRERILLCVAVPLAVFFSTFHVVRYVTSKTVWVAYGCAMSTNIDNNRVEFSRAALVASYHSLRSYKTILWDHNDTYPVGKLTAIRLWKDKLYVRMEISKSRAKLWRFMREGLVTGLSVGVTVTASEPMWFGKWSTEGRRIQEGRAVEISIVTVPANPNARITECRVVRRYKCPVSPLIWIFNGP